MGGGDEEAKCSLGHLAHISHPIGDCFTSGSTVGQSCSHTWLGVSATLIRLSEMSLADEAGGPGQASPFCDESVIYIIAFKKKKKDLEHEDRIPAQLCW